MVDIHRYILFLELKKYDVIITKLWGLTFFISISKIECTNNTIQSNVTKCGISLLCKTANTAWLFQSQFLSSQLN